MTDSEENSWISVFSGKPGERIVEFGKQVYQDVAQDPLQQLSTMIEDYFFVTRIDLAKERIEKRKLLEEARERVPPEQQLENPVDEVIQPALDSGVNYRKGELREMFTTLISRALDQGQVDKAHPAHVHILKQLSPDEALILKRLYQKGRADFFERKVREDVDDDTEFEEEEPGERFRGITNDIYEGWEHEVLLDIEGLNLPKFQAMYVSHLRSLNLVGLEQDVEGTNEVIAGTDEFARVTLEHKIGLTQFGKNFGAACIESREVDSNQNAE